MMFRLLEVAYGDAASYLVERDVFLGLETLDTLELLALVRHFPCAAFILHDIEGVAGLRGLR